MRVLITISMLFALFASCKSPTFTYVKEADHSSSVIEFTLDNSYNLYTKSICKDSRGFPMNCPDTIRPMESGYIIMSNSNKKVLVINNIPNRNQKFFDEGVVYEKVMGTDTVYINVFFFKQFRFGTLDTTRRSNPPMKFESVGKSPTKFIWNYEEANNILQINSVANVTSDGQDIRNTESSLYLVPTFAKSNNFKFVFQLPPNMTDTVITNTSNVRIFVHKKSKKNYITYFEFKTPVYKDFRAIKFMGNRMYAFSR
jgi:hypothetical protein